MAMEVQGLGLELSLRLPGGSMGNKYEKKRVFSDIGGDNPDGKVSSKEHVVGWPPVGNKYEKKRVFSEIGGDNPDGKVSNKEQVVGWPPVCSYRRKNSLNGRETMSLKMYVKVSMDGAPFLRKIDMSSHKGYSDLVMALEKLFGCYGIGAALKDADNGEYVPIYEDKDGDWMLVGDVPWEMFIVTCKRLRIKKKSDGGLQTKDLLKG